MEKEKYIPKILDVLIWPDVGLKIECHPVETFDDDLTQLAADMFATMAARGGVGLAAPQVGRILNMITLRLEEKNPMILINPEITVLTDEDFEWEEGCLSVPGHFEMRHRPANVAVKFQDLTGKEHNVNFKELYAFAIQHEFDHLRGKCFVDGASIFKRNRINKKIKRELPRFDQRVELMKQQLVNQELQSRNTTEA